MQKPGKSPKRPVSLTDCRYKRISHASEDAWDFFVFPLVFGRIFPLSRSIVNRVMRSASDLHRRIVHFERVGGFFIVIRHRSVDTAFSKRVAVVVGGGVWRCVEFAIVFATATLDSSPFDTVGGDGRIGGCGLFLQGETAVFQRVFYTVVAVCYICRTGHNALVFRGTCRVFGGERGDLL